MTLQAFYLIIISIFMHSSWHFLCKSSGRSSMAFFALFSTSLFLTMLPFALSSGLPGKIPFQLLIYAFCGGICGALGNIGFMSAYRYSDISLAYPMARALPVFLTMLITTLFGWGKMLTPWAITGMVIIFSGCLLMAFSNGPSGISVREKLNFLKKGLAGILLAAAATTAYTIIDKFGIDAMVKYAPKISKIQVAGTYSCIRESIILSCMWFAVFCCKIRGEEKGILKELVTKYHPYIAGIFAALAYVLILVAINSVSNVSFVQAFRQLSLPLSALLGFLILKEKVSKIRWIALTLIMLGLFLSLF